MKEQLTDSERIKKIIDYSGLSASKFAKAIGCANPDVLYHIQRGRNGISGDVVEKIVKFKPEINMPWILTGKGEMLKDKSPVQIYESENAPSVRRLIPLYDDVSTIGGNNNYTAKLQPDANATEWIDPGDWFKSATHAIRHYEDSMVEYPSGCILAMREVKDRQLVIWGRDYVIETSEFRITKRLQRGKNEDYIKAYSSNTDVYPDGQLMHEHLDIPWKEIDKLYLVIGLVIKQGDGTTVYVNQNK